MPSRSRPNARVRRLPMAFSASATALSAWRRSPGRRYFRDSDRARRLRSNQCNGLDRFPGSAVSPRKGITAGGYGRSRSYPSPNGAGTGIAAAAIACADRHVKGDCRNGARDKRVRSDASRSDHRQHVPSLGPLASLSRSGVDHVGAAQARSAPRRRHRRRRRSSARPCLLPCSTIADTVTGDPTRKGAALGEQSTGSPET